MNNDFKIFSEEFDNLMCVFMDDSNFENTVIHEVDHYIGLKNGKRF